MRPYGGEEVIPEPGMPVVQFTGAPLSGELRRPGDDHIHRARDTIETFWAQPTPPLADLASKEVAGDLFPPATRGPTIGLLAPASATGDAYPGPRRGGIYGIGEHIAQDLAQLRNAPDPEVCEKFPLEPDLGSPDVALLVVALVLGPDLAQPSFSPLAVSALLL